MRIGWFMSVALAAALAAAGQTPPANAKDITQLPPSANATAMAALPGAQVVAPANLLRIYVSSLSGSDASAIAGLITQALYESKQVVVTNQQSNASLILQGSVVREPAPAKPAARGHGKGRAAAPASDSGLGEASPSDLALLNSLGGGGTDMARYRYRLDLEVYNPNGDLMWMSGQGRQALPFAGADQAVQQTVNGLLAVIATWTPAPAAKP